MSVSKITITVYDGHDQLVSKHMIDDKIVDNDDIHIESTFYKPDGTIFSKSRENGWDADAVIDSYMSTKPNVVGEYTTIQIDQLAPSDLDMFNRLFSKPYEIPDCVSFKVDPSVGLTRLPTVSESMSETCPICLDNLYDKPASYISGNKIGTHYCNHKFHTECIRNYCDHKDGNCLCPVCRNKINPGDIRPLAGGGRRKRRSTKKRRASKRRRSTSRRRKYNRRH